LLLGPSDNLRDMAKTHFKINDALFFASLVCTRPGFFRYNSRVKLRSRNWLCSIAPSPSSRILFPVISRFRRAGPTRSRSAPLGPRLPYVSKNISENVWQLRVPKCRRGVQASYEIREEFEREMAANSSYLTKRSKARVIATTSVFCQAFAPLGGDQRPGATTTFPGRHAHGSAATRPPVVTHRLLPVRTNIISCVGIDRSRNGVLPMPRTSGVSPLRLRSCLSNFLLTNATFAQSSVSRRAVRVPLNRPSNPPRYCPAERIRDFFESDMRLPT